MPSAEELLNDFEAAFRAGEYDRAAELVRLAKFKLENDSSLAKVIPVNDLIGMSTTVEDEELAEEISSLLRILFIEVDFASLLSTYESYFSMALKSERIGTLSIGLDFITKALVPNYSTAPLPEPILKSFLNLLTHHDTFIAERVIQILSQSDLIKQRQEWILTFLTNLSKSNSIVKSRISTVLAQVDYNNIDDSTTITKWTGVLDMLQSDDNDTLLIATGLEIVIEECKSPFDLATAFQSGILNVIASLANCPSQDLTIRSRSILSLGKLTRIEDSRDIMGGFFEQIHLKSILDNQLQSDHIPLLGSAYFLIASLAGNIHLVHNYHSWIESIITSTKFLGALFHGAGGYLNQVTIEACTWIMSRTATTLEPLQRKLFEAMKTFQSKHPIEAFIYQTKTTLDQSKEGIYELLTFMLQHSWLTQEAIISTNLVSFLLNQQPGQTIPEIRLKYQLIRTVLSCDNLDDTIRVQLQTFLAKETVNPPSAVVAIVATQNR